MLSKDLFILRDTLRVMIEAGPMRYTGSKRRADQFCDRIIIMVLLHQLEGLRGPAWAKEGKISRSEAVTCIGDAELTLGCASGVSLKRYYDMAEAIKETFPYGRPLLLC